MVFRILQPPRRYRMVLRSISTNESPVGQIFHRLRMYPRDHHALRRVSPSHSHSRTGTYSHQLSNCAFLFSIPFSPSSIAFACDSGRCAHWRWEWRSVLLCLSFSQKVRSSGASFAGLSRFFKFSCMRSWSQNLHHRREFLFFVAPPNSPSSLTVRF